MKPQSNIIPLHDAVVIKGQRAWTFIKKSAADQRQAWREVGEALAYGRKLHSSNQAFGKWVTEQGFDDIDPSVRSNAMWLAQNWSSCDGHKTESHPDRIRKAVNESLKDLPPTPELTLSTPTKLTASIEQVAPQAKVINKLSAMAERGFGQEKETAQKYLDKKAKGFGMETAELVSLSKKLEPAAGVSPSNQVVLASYIEDIAEALSQAAVIVQTTQRSACSTPISKEFAMSMFLRIFNQLNIG